MHPVHDRVLEFIANPARGKFEELALEVFAHQFEKIDVYRRFCEQRGLTPDSVRTWAEIPAIPVQIFKEIELCCGPAERIFFSSGTTMGTEKRSRHCMPDLRLYHGSAIGGLKRFLFPDVDRIRIVSLIHDAAERPESSLSQMVSWASESFGKGETVVAVRGATIDFDAVAAALAFMERSGEPCCLMATTAALIRLLDWCRESGRMFRLAHGSRIMDTGGEKGAPRKLSRKGLLHACWNTFAVPGYFCVNEYGMAELASQYYENVIAARVAGRHTPRVLEGPPWARVLVLDPGSLRPVPPGQRGLLCHFDLANAGSAVAVLTQDVGRVAGNGFELLGRAAGAEARGCSLMLAEWEAGA